MSVAACIFDEMIRRSIRLGGLKREILAAIFPGRGEPADTIKRRVATGRGLAPESWNWNAFLTSFARSLRTLEKEGALEVERGTKTFQRVCATWVRLTLEGERARTQLVGPSELGLGELGGEIAPDVLAHWEQLVARAREADLLSLVRIVETERSRRAARSP